MKPKNAIIVPILIENFISIYFLYDPLFSFSIPYWLNFVLEYPLIVAIGLLLNYVLTLGKMNRPAVLTILLTPIFFILFFFLPSFLFPYRIGTYTAIFSGIFLGFIVAYCVFSIFYEE